MARWLVELIGEQFDLEEIPRNFPSGDVFGIWEDGKVYLTGPGFETLAEAEDVRNAARDALNGFAGITLLLWPAFRRPKTNAVYRETDDGARHAWVFLEGAVEMRAKVGAVLTTEPGAASGPTTAQEVLACAQGSRHLLTALTLFSDSSRSWSRLYRILEEIEGHLGESVDSAGFCSSAERKRFTHTANTAEVAGIDARHAAGRFRPPSNPMTPAEGYDYVRRMLESALQ